MCHHFKLACHSLHDLSDLGFRNLNSGLKGFGMLQWGFVGFRSLGNIVCHILRT